MRGQREVKCGGSKSGAEEEKWKWKRVGGEAD